MMLAAHNAGQGQKILEGLATDRARLEGAKPPDEAETQSPAEPPASLAYLADEASASDVAEECDSDNVDRAA